MENELKFSEKLKEARKKNDMTQKLLSEKYSIPLRTIEDWEANKRIPPIYLQKFLLDDLLKDIRAED